MRARQARAVRGALAAGVATFIAALFHIAGGGAVPGVAAVALSLAFSMLACVALAGKRLSWTQMTVSVLISQILFHLLLSLGQPSTQVILHVTGHVHVGAPSLPASVPTTTAGMAGMPDLPAPLMWLSHATAAVVTIIVLRFGERTFWKLYEFTVYELRRVAAAALPAAPLATPLHAMAPDVPVRSVVQAPWLTATPRRGPPAGIVSPG